MRKRHVIFSLCFVIEIVRRNKEKDLFKNQSCSSLIQEAKASIAVVLHSGVVTELAVTQR